MEYGAFLKGLVIGFLIAVPVGPVGLLCIQRTLDRGFLVGFISGLGAAVADGIYGAVAVFGVSALSNLLVAHQEALALVGGLMLIFVGLRLLKREAKEVEPSRGAGVRDRFSAFASSFAITIANPATILAFGAIVAGFGLIKPEADLWQASLMTLGVFLGSTAWWWCLAAGSGLLRHRLTTGVRSWINRVGGIALLVFGSLALLDGLVTG